ncbi:hypothetical protein GH865_10250 [Rhodocyclus tenuis]|uniref:replication initiation factor domain-containing protein n=1 Tax=Rhodocyclus gracilis TaxID=2929842 RepID=UPI001298C198|nr:replication initiation factor domain-containing protein [Rhodocyclus gracilis]MRD73630.1 hypothetical protein [Rhodocyclus gracilis]
MESPFNTPTEIEQNHTGLGLAVRIDALAATAQPNEAGTALVDLPLEREESATPRLVIRGESSWHEAFSENGEKFTFSAVNGRAKLIALPQPLASGVATAALVDYLNCSFPFEGDAALAIFFGELFDVLGRAFSPATPRGKGLHGYTRSFDLGESSAQFAYGGNRDTGFLTFPGGACHQIPDWEKLIAFLRDGLRARITRWDGAVDDYDGLHSVDAAVAMYHEGLFGSGGRKPLINQSGNWIDPDGHGRTFYVGNRKNGKLLRVYEKGMQLGIRWHPWVRWEVELHNTDREIPWEAVLEPGKFVAGAYPKALSWVSEEQTRIRTLQRTSRIGYDALTHWASIGYGKLIDLMLQVEGSAEKVVEKLRREGLPARLDLPSLPGTGKVIPTCEP